MKKEKFRAYIHSLGWLVPVENIDFTKKTLEVDLTNGFGKLLELDFREVTLNYYTGLFDINGKEICESDIVKLDKFPIDKYKVVREEDSFILKQCGLGNKIIPLEENINDIVILYNIYCPI